MTRWNGIVRDWNAEDILRLRGSIDIKYTVSDLMSRRLWRLMNGEGVRALGASTPAQAVQMVQAGLDGIYLSGWQIAADVNSHMYPDQSLYPADRAPKLCRAINNALLRHDKIDSSSGQKRVDSWLVPIVADGEAGFGGVLNVYELTKRMIEAGAAGVHFEDQLSSEKKCGHLGGKVLVPTSEFIKKLKAARLAADVSDVPLVIIARTDANSARLLTSDVDVEDRKFIKWENPSDSTVDYRDGRTQEGFYYIKGGIKQAIQRGLAYAPYADVLWCETSTPDIGEAREFAQAIHEKYPGKLLAYNCSPSFNWSKHLDSAQIARFQDTLMELGYKFQFITLAGFHALNESMFKLARQYKNKGMTAYSSLQDREFSYESLGYCAAKHQTFVGTGYFDDVRGVIDKDSSTGAMLESTEAEQFK